MNTLLRRTVYLIAASAAIYSAAILFLIVDGRRNSGESADYAVILGNRVELTGQPSPRLQARLDAGAELYNAGRTEKLIVSGGFGKEGYDEADVMADYLIARGIPAEAILRDHEGVNSHATSVNTLKLIGKECSIIAVTQLFHVSRSKLSLRNAGFRDVSGHYPRYFELRDIYSFTREIPAWIKYRIKKL